MSPIICWVLLTGGLFLGMITLMEAGRHIGVRLQGKQGGIASAGFGVLEGALFALMGLILAFSFSGAGERLDARRQLIVEEANCVGTAYLRLDLLPTQAQPELREKFRQYVDARLAAYAALPDMAKTQAAIDRSITIQNEIWTKAVAATKQPAGSLQATLLVIPALNEMFDIGNTQYMSAKIHPPLVIYVLMGVLILICSLLAGFEMGFNRNRSWLHVFAFATLLAITVYTIIELEFPRLGLVNVSNFDQTLVDIRNSMN
jgi:hypothetical protein